MQSIVTILDIQNMYLKTEYYGTFTPIYEYESYDSETKTYKGLKVMKTAKEVYNEWLNDNFDLVDGEWIPKQIDICPTKTTEQFLAEIMIQML